MKNVLVLAHKNDLRPSLRYRIVFPLDFLDRKKLVKYKMISLYSYKTEKLLSTNKSIKKIINVFIDIIIFILSFLMVCRKKYDAVIVKDFLIPLGGGGIEKFFFLLLKTKKIIYDLDDAIYFNHTRKQNMFFSKFRHMDYKVAFWLRYSSKVIIPNNFIKSDLEKLYSLQKEKTELLLSCPMEKQYYNDIMKINKYSDDGNIPIVWLGSSHTQADLEMFKDVIHNILAAFPNVHIYFVGVTDDWKDYDEEERVHKLKWTPENEILIMRKSVFGINPLRNDDFQKRKSAFKVIQYYRAGIYPLVSDVGINNDLIKKFGGFCIKGNTSSNNIIAEMKRHIAHLNENSRMLYKRSKELTVENNSMCILKLINEL